jgi:hypothetical protein
MSPLGRRPRPEPERTPEPEEVIDPVRAVEAGMTAAKDAAWAADLAGNTAAARVARARIEYLQEKWARLRAQAGGVR